MKRNGRLSLALHTLAHMARSPERVRTSAEIAEHIGTNPVVVRRVLGGLRKAGLLKSEKGHAGGWRLARMPEKITLSDVYLALDERLIVHDGIENNSNCLIEQTLHKKISGVLKEVEESLMQKLARTSIIEICEP